MEHTSGSDAQALYPAQPGARAESTSWLTLGLQFLLGVGVGVGGIMLADRVTGGLDGRTMAALFVALPLALWVQLLLHEAGHALAGLLVGRRFVGAGVGPLRLERGDGAWTLRWGGGISGVGGFAAMLPRGPEGRGAAAVVLVAGPLANLLAAGLAAFALARLEAPGMVSGAALGASAVAGTLLGVANLLPFRSRGWNSDGRGLLELMRGDSVWRVTQAQQLVVAAAMAGVRPRDWPADPLAQAHEVPAPLQAGAHSLRMSMALDRDDMATARDAALALAALWPGTPDGQRQGVALMLASYAARGGDAALLAAWRPHCEGGMLDLSPYRLWLDAEAALLGGDHDAARVLVRQAREALPRVHDRSGVVVLGDWLDALEQRSETLQLRNGNRSH